MNLFQTDIAQKQVILGVCPSKSNSYRIGMIKFRNGDQKATMFKTAQMEKYEKSFFLQCNLYRNLNHAGLFEFELDVFYPSNRSDLDGALKATLDILQKHVKAFTNDNNCVKITARKFVDKVNPRIEFIIKPL